jgi:surfeit locus 1 family protein
LAAIFALLGQWQLRRAGERAALDAQFAAHALGPRLEALPDAPVGGELRYRAVALHGRYLPETQVLADNMTHAGVAGYHVLTPFLATDGRVAVVNRGFVPAPASRSELPNIAVSAEARSVRGRIDTFPMPALRLTAAATGTAAVRVLSFPEPKDLEHALGAQVAPYQILLDADEPDGFVRAWEPRGIRAERNLAYAGQWFALSLATVGAGLGWWLKSRLRKRGAV